MSDTLSIERVDGIAWVIVNRPEVRNALDTALCADLVDAFSDLAEDPDTRVVVLRGAGERAFISGADVNEFRERLATPEGALAYDEEAEALMAAIEAVPRPVVAMIHGFAIGTGLLVAMACDLRIASDAVRVGIPAAPHRTGSAGAGRRPPGASGRPRPRQGPADEPAGLSRPTKPGLADF